MDINHVSIKVDNSDDDMVVRHMLSILGFLYYNNTDPNGVSCFKNIV